MSIKIISLNVRGIRDTLKRRAIFNFYRNKGNIICLQETHSTEDDMRKWEMEWGGEILFNHGTTKSKGVCILLQKGMKKHVKATNMDNEGRRISIQFEVNNVILSICNIYTPNDDNPHFFNEVLKELSEMTENIIIVGDFNLVLNPCMDCIGSEHTKTNAVNVLQKGIEEMLLCDIWRISNTAEKRFSWYRCKPKLCASRIDFGIISQGLADMCENTGYTTGLKTDHLAFFLYFNIMAKPRGPGYWKLNNLLLRKENYLMQMNQLIETTFETNPNKDPVNIWEYLKYRIRDETREYSKQNAAEIDLIVAQLAEKVDEMQQNLESCNLMLLQRTKDDLEEFMQHKARSCIFKSKVNYTEMGEKPTKYFLNMEKSRYNARTCYALYDEKNNGKLITDTKGILKLQENFYRSLYSKNDQVQFNWVNNTEINISEDLKVGQGLPFCESEIAEAIMQLPNGKTCGNDGIPVDFYKIFWTRIKKPFMAMVNCVFERKRMNRSALLGVINVISKPGKNPRYLSGLRPITLLNTDYKILEKALANRMEHCMDFIISSDQRGFLKNRRISSNIRMIFELMKYTEDNNISAFILSLDFQKCFDMI